MDLVTARLLARKGVLVPTDFTSLLAWRLEKGGAAADEPGFNGVITEVLMEEQSVTSNSGYATLDAMEGIVPELNIVVTFDGVKYKCPLFYNDGGETCYGNGNLCEGSANGNDMPFAIKSYLDMDFVSFEEIIVWELCTDAGDTGSHTIKVEREIVLTKNEIVVDGTESMTFSAANNAVYFMKSDIAGKNKEYFINPGCTHFTYGDGNVLAQMNDGEFIFNMSSASGNVASGNISFKNVSAFTSLANAVAWFNEQAANGTPVTITYYVKE